MQRAVALDRQLEVDGEVLVRSEVVDDPPEPFAVDHRGVEASLVPGDRILAHEGDGLAAQRVAVGIVLDAEGHVHALIRDEDVAHPPDLKEGHRPPWVPIPTQA
jgi:hypothetical protein